MEWVTVSAPNEGSERKAGDGEVVAVSADPSLCQGYANCVVGAEDYFDIDESGVVVVLRSEVRDRDVGRVTVAAQACPVSALKVE